MDFDSLPKVWRSLDGEIHRARTERLAPVRDRVKAIERRIRRRDALEIGAAILGLPLFLALSWFVFQTGMPVAAAGALLLAVSCVTIPLRFRRERPVESPLDLPVVDALRGELDFLQRQERLIRSVAVWYVGPILAGALIFVFGIPSTPAYRIRFAVLVTALATLAVLVNRQTARQVLRPLIAELKEWLADLQAAETENGGSDAS